VSAGLHALGAGLGANGDPGNWTVDRGTAAIVAPALGEAVAAHIAVAADVLRVGTAGSASEADTAVLRGLGYLTVHDRAATAVEAALVAWAHAEYPAVPPRNDCAPVEAVAVPSAFVAVQHYGQRLEHALDGFADQEAAEDRKFWWDATAGLVTEFWPGPAGRVAGVVEGYVAIWLDLDGTWDPRHDDGATYDRADAAAAVRAALPAETRSQIEGYARQAHTAMELTARVLGDPLPPEPPEKDYLAPVLEAVVPEADDLRRVRNPAGDAGFRPGSFLPGEHPTPK
jgi:hypothetical protein